MADQEKKEWFSNKDLFEMIQGLKDEMTETRSIIKRYNGIRKDLADVMNRVKSMEERAAGRNQVLEIILKWGGWFVAIATLYMKLKGVI